MIRFRATEATDLPAIGEWINSDPDHCDKMSREWWMRGNKQTLACCRVDDDLGPIMYLRLDRESDLVRLHTQFGPPDLVSKKRIASAMASGFESLALTMRATGVRGIIFESVSIPLIQFMKGMNFKHREGNDYLLDLEETHVRPIS